MTQLTPVDHDPFAGQGAIPKDGANIAGLTDVESPQGQQMLQTYGAEHSLRGVAHSVAPGLTDYLDPPPLTPYQATTPLAEQGRYTGGKVVPNQPDAGGALMDIASNIAGPEAKAGLLAKPLLGAIMGPGKFFGKEAMRGWF